MICLIFSGISKAAPDLEIENAIFKLRLNVYYEIPASERRDRWEQGMWRSSILFSLSLAWSSKLFSPDSSVLKSFAKKASLRMQSRIAAAWFKKTRRWPRTSTMAQRAGGGGSSGRQIIPANSLSRWRVNRKPSASTLRRSTVSVWGWVSWLIWRLYCFLVALLKFTPISVPWTVSKCSDHLCWEKRGVWVVLANAFLSITRVPLTTVPRVTISGIPIEFIYQHFKKTREANDTKMIQWAIFCHAKNCTSLSSGILLWSSFLVLSIPRKVLSYYDQISGTNLIQDVENKRTLLSERMDADRGLAMYNLRVSTESLPLRSKVLNQPKIKFAQSNKEANNGSFDLRNINFARCVAPSWLHLMLSNSF